MGWDSARIIWTSNWSKLSFFIFKIRHVLHLLPQSICLLTLASNWETTRSCCFKSKFSSYSRAGCSAIKMDVYGMRKGSSRNGFVINLSITSDSLRRRPNCNYTKTFFFVREMIISGSKFQKACEMPVTQKS